MTQDEIINKATEKVGNHLKLAYNMAQAIDILTNTIGRKLSPFGGMKHEKKQHYRRFVQSIEAAYHWYSKAFEPELEESTGGEWRKLDGYRQDANELIRFVMLYIDRSATYDNYRKIRQFLENMPEGGVFSDKDIKEFEFVAEYRKEK